MIAVIGSGFDSFVESNNLPQWRSIVNLNKNRGGNISLKVDIG